MKINKNIIIGAAFLSATAVAILLWMAFGTSAPIKSSSVEAKNGDITEKVNLAGEVMASQGVDLSFVISGRIAANYVKVGDKVYAGQIIAALNQSSALAALTSAKGSLAQAQASYEKLIAGAKAENIQAVQDSISSAKQNLANAYTGSVNTLNNAYASMYNAYNAVSSIKDTYFMSQDPQGNQVSNSKDDISANMQSAQVSITSSEKTMIPSDMDSAISQAISSLTGVYNDMNNIRSQCDQGIYYYKVTSADKSSLDGQKALISASLTSATSLQQSIASLKIAIQSAQDQLKVTTAPPTQAETDMAKAQILSAQGQVNAAQASLANTVIWAPFSGQVDKDNAVVGQISSPNVPVATVSNSNLEIDANIPQIDVAAAKVGSKADVVLDAFGNGVVFPATIISIDSATTLVNGIPVYAAKLKFDNNDSRVKTGMTANITLISATHSNVLTVPISAVIQQNGKYFVMADNGSSRNELREVSVGIRDDKNIEITSGLKTGEKVLAY